MEDDKYTPKHREKTSLLRDLHKQIYTKLINFIDTVNVSILCDETAWFSSVTEFRIFRPDNLLAIVLIYVMIRAIFLYKYSHGNV